MATPSAIHVRAVTRGETRLEAVLEVVPLLLRMVCFMLGHDYWNNAFSNPRCLRGLVQLHFICISFYIVLNLMTEHHGLSFYLKLHA